jgi:hypothetical protein
MILMAPVIIVVVIAADVVVELAARGKLRRNSVVGIRTHEVRKNAASWKRGHEAAVWPSRITVLLVLPLEIIALSVDSEASSMILLAAGIALTFCGTGAAAYAASLAAKNIEA